MERGAPQTPQARGTRARGSRRAIRSAAATRRRSSRAPSRLASAATSETGPTRMIPPTRRAPAWGVPDVVAVVQPLVGARRVPGQENAAVSAPADEGDHRPDVFDALPEALERRAGEGPAAAGDDVVTAVVELEVRDAGRVQALHERPRARRAQASTRTRA